MTEPKTPRVRRTPAQKATEALQAARARHGKAVANRDRLAELIEDAEAELYKAQAHLQYAQQHPDLPAQDTALDEAAQASDGFGVSRA